MSNQIVAVDNDGDSVSCSRLLDSHAPMQFSTGSNVCSRKLYTVGEIQQDVDRCRGLRPVVKPLPRRVVSMHSFTVPRLPEEALMNGRSVPRKSALPRLQGAIYKPPLSLVHELNDASDRASLAGVALVEAALRKHRSTNVIGQDWHCPAHDDEHASLGVTVGDSGKVLLNCAAGLAASHRQEARPAHERLVSCGSSSAL